MTRATPFPSAPTANPSATTVSRRDMTIGASLTVAAAAAVRGGAAFADPGGPVVVSSAGRLRGGVDRGVLAFRGIP